MVAIKKSYHAKPVLNARGGSCQVLSRGCQQLRDIWIKLRASLIQVKQLHQLPLGSTLSALCQGLPHSRKRRQVTPKRYQVSRPFSDRCFFHNRLSLCTLTTYPLTSRNCSRAWRGGWFCALTCSPSQSWSAFVSDGSSPRVGIVQSSQSSLFLGIHPTRNGMPLHPSRIATI